LQRSSSRVVLREIHGDKFVDVSGNDLLRQIQRAREAVRRRDLQPGDRCALLAANSIRWIVIDLALMAEGVIVVPLYSRQAPAELVAVVQDCHPRLLVAGAAALRDAVVPAWSGVDTAPPQTVLFDELSQTATSG